MSAIRVIFHGKEPPFPATDQHPNATRFYIYAAGIIVPAVQEDGLEKARIDAQQQAIVDTAIALQKAVDAITAAEAATAEAVAGAEAMVEPAPEAAAIDPALEAARAAAEQAYAAAFALDMPPAQRAFLPRITAMAARDSYIKAPRKARQQTIDNAEPIVHAVDAIGVPTMQEVNAVLNPPAAKTPAAREVDQIKSDPAALAALKAALAVP